MNKLTVNQLILLNKKVQQNNEQCKSKVKDEVLKEIVNIPYQKDEEFFYIYRSALEKASKLGCCIAQKKPFEIKNTETATLAALTLLELNGYKMVDYKDDMNNLMNLFENNEYEKACEWIKKHNKISDKSML